ncbi:hypothetical protein KEH51_04500 [[Brevibacterium] frigoritolerans]|uniref:Uncharacterized protein n=1 Tax=Peribacillus frigoritolerans TaxID=450367 RepID=A0A941J4Q0_9BACI|nr:hypothetical protein [Peribacillus frigoritolerans]
MIGTEGTRLLRGKRPRETPQAPRAPRRLPDRPRKASARSEINVHILNSLLKKCRKS